MTEELVVPEKQEVGSVLSAITRAASDSSTRIDVIRELWAMQRELLDRNADMAFSQAMQSAQSEMLPIVKDLKGDKGKMYASLEAIDKAIRPIYTRHGFALTFGTETSRDVEHVNVTCDVRHIGGHSKTYSLEGALDTTGDKGTANKTAIKGLGSSVRYLRRYLVTMIFNLMLADELDPDDMGGQKPKPLLSQEQLQKIYDMVGALEMGDNAIAGMLAMAGVTRIEAMKESQFEPVMTLLRAKLKARQGVK